MLKKRFIVCLTFLDGVLFRTRNFKADYRYTKEFINLWNIDELIIIDISNKKFSKKFIELIEYFSNNCFVPITVGGGISSVDDAAMYFNFGADKIIVGYRGLENESIKKNISNIYGNQSIVQSLDIKKKEDKYYLYGESGKRQLEINIFKNFLNMNNNYYGEILINDINNDGGMMGFDLRLVKEIQNYTKNPLILVGGGGNWSHFTDVFKLTSVSAVCTQNIFHFTEKSISILKKNLIKESINIRI
jgi:imidazole glycerol-phosphate synthase subunit HisF